MRTLINSALTVTYPDDFVFSGDLNRVSVIKNTTATHIELSFTIDGYNYKENLYFLTPTIDFSLSETLNLLFTRSFNTVFNTVQTFDFTIKIYNNTTLIDTESFSIGTVIFGKRRAFDKLGVMPNIFTADYDNAIGIQYIDYYFTSASTVYLKLMDGSTVSLGSFPASYQIFNIAVLEATHGTINYLYWIQDNLLLNPTFQYLGTLSYWTYEQFPLCGTIFGIHTILNLLRFTITNSSCGDTLTTTYYGGTFIPGKSYKCTIVVDEVKNPTGADQYIQFNLGGNTGTAFVGTGTFTETLVCGAGNLLQLVGYFNTLSFLEHFFSAISIDVHEFVETSIYLNKECLGVGKKLGLRFKNRFGLWRTYYVINKQETIASTNGVPLWFLENNLSELNDTFNEQNKNYSQSISVYRESLTKEQVNEFSDIIYSDYVHIYDEINALWIPIRVSTNSFNIVDKETLFDVSLNLLLQSTNG